MRGRRPGGRNKSSLLKFALPLVTSIAAMVLALSPASGAPAPSSIQGPSLRATPKAPGSFLSGDSKTNCVYPDSNLTDLAMLGSLVGTTYNCVLLFNDAKPNWQTWVNVWWASPPSPASAWLSWLHAEPGRRLVISQPMVPNDAPSNWAVLGAEGAYDPYATQLASNLVAKGMGNSVIRLGWEANNPANYENALPGDPSEYADWARYWDNIVTAMRAVPGAAFQFDWTVNQYYQPVPLEDWYPGNAYVDIVGIDAYDSGVYQGGLTSEQRWQQLYDQPDGLGAVAAFAAAHGKPLSIPEWGLASPAVGGAGDDPTYVQGLGSFIADHAVEYNSYFYSYSVAPDNLVYLPNAPQSLAAYQESFPGIASAPNETPTSAAGTTSPDLTSTSTTTTASTPTTVGATAPTTANTATTTRPTPSAVVPVGPPASPRSVSAPSPSSGPAPASPSGAAASSFALGPTASRQPSVSPSRGEATTATSKAPTARPNLVSRKPATSKATTSKAATSKPVCSKPSAPKKLKAKSNESQKAKAKMVASKRAKEKTAKTTSAAPKAKRSSSHTKDGRTQFGSECTESSKPRAGTCSSNTKIGPRRAAKRVGKSAHPANTQSCRLQARAPEHIVDRTAQRKNKHLHCTKAPARSSSKPRNSCQTPPEDRTNKIGKGNGRPSSRLPTGTRHTGVTSVSNAPGHGNLTREKSELGQLSSPSS